jgi:dephospho-CoA kinase
MLKIGLLGRMASGKTTLSEFFIDKYKATRVAFADALKEDLIKYALTPDGTIIKSRDRALLQNYGQLRRGELSTIDLSPYRILYNDNGKFIMEELELEHKFQLGWCYPEIWIDEAIKKALELATTSNVIIEDIRRKNEAEALRKHGFSVIKINASDEARKNRLIQRDGYYHESSLHNISESEVDDIPYDFIIDNNEDNENSLNELATIVTMIPN